MVQKIHWTEVLSSHFNFFFSDKTLVILKWFFSKYVHCNGVKLSGVLEEFFLSLQDFWVQKCINQFFEENKHFECSFLSNSFTGDCNPT